MEPTTDEPEIIVEDPQIAQAKASMFARMDELQRRFKSAKAAVDIEAHIVANPLAAAGIALAAGLLLGARGASRSAKATPAAVAAAAEKASIVGTLLGLAGSLAIGLAKDLVMKQLGGYAKDWWDANNPTEAKASHAPETASFLEH